jgi:hypothetical protein
VSNPTGLPSHPLLGTWRRHFAPWDSHAGKVAETPKACRTNFNSGKHEWKWYIHCFVHYLIIYPINKETFAVPGLFPDLKRWSTLLPLGESQRLNLALTYYYDEAGDCWKDPHDQENKSAAWWNMMNYSHHPNTVLNTPQMVPIMWIFPSKPWFLRGCLILGVRDYKGFATLHVSCKRYA